MESRVQSHEVVEMVRGAERPEVHGLTTATSVWLSAAVGILCGGGLYVPSAFTTFAGVVYLRFAPRLPAEPQHGDDPSDDLEDNKVLDNIAACSSLGCLNSLQQPLDPAGANGIGANPPVRSPSSKSLGEKRTSRSGASMSIHA